jgi:uncharacterized membrane protein
MDERKEVVIVCLALLALGVIFFFISILYSFGFNFNKAELNIQGNLVNEKLYYHTDKQYHTLFRNFKTPTIIESSESSSVSSEDGFILVDSVSCKEGTPYAKNSFGSFCYIFPEKVTHEDCPYTEPNEYGCTFGNVYGFNKGEDYWIQSSFILSPKTLFKMNGKYYIKFVAYSAGRHKLLISGSNFLVDEDIVSKRYYLPKEDVILYIQYPSENISKYNVVPVSKLDFGNVSILLFILVFSSPAVLFFILWLIFGKENLRTNFPSQMSFYPRERKGWEVAAYFNPPFSTIDKNLFAAIILDFYRRKIIDTKMVGKEVYIRIVNPSNPSIDSIERLFVNLIEMLYIHCPQKYKDGEYFNLKKSANGFWVRTLIRSSVPQIQRDIKKEGEKYLSQIVFVPLGILFFLIFFISMPLISLSPAVFVFFFISYFLIMLISSRSSLLIRFKGEYYREYEHWQSWRNYIKSSPTLTTIEHKGVILWEQHLVYASALRGCKKGFERT